MSYFFGGWGSEGGEDEGDVKNRQEPTPMRCHYEVMEIEMKASADEIKKQYRKLALKYHPDRHHGQEEWATQKFKELGAAYNVLSDPQERKWYDDHRDAILRGGDGTSGGGSDADDSANLWKYFNTSCYNGHDDNDPQGFYGVYGAAFEEIWRQECKAANSTSSTSSTSAKKSGGANSTAVAPMFGSSDTADGDMLKFYAYWENFATKLSFSWTDTYNTLEAPNRATKRMMEKENVKVREAARREYTNQIRSLARYVKKRDPRYANFDNEARRRKEEAEELKKALKLEEAQQRKDKRNKQLQEYENNVEYQELRAEERKKAFLLADDDDDDEEEEDGDEDRAAGEFFYVEEEDEEEEGGEEALFKEAATITLDDFIQKAPPATTAATAAAVAVAEHDINSSKDITVNNDNCSGDLGDDQDFSCEACSKSFKSDSQLNQHLNSKVHRKKVQELEKAARKKK